MLSIQRCCAGHAPTSVRRAPKNALNTTKTTAVFVLRHAGDVLRNADGWPVSTSAPERDAKCEGFMHGASARKLRVALLLRHLTQA